MIYPGAMEGIDEVELQMDSSGSVPDSCVAANLGAQLVENGILSQVFIISVVYSSVITLSLSCFTL